MIYNYKEYSNVFETPAKKQQEKVIAEKIMTLLNNNKFDNLDEFISKNSTYQDFLKNNNMTNVIKHFGNTISEEDYIQIIYKLKSLTNDKHNFEKDNIKTTNIDDKQYISYKGDNNYYLDNSNSKLTIEEQMKNMQKDYNSFQSSNIKDNAEKMFQELSNNVKENINFKYLYEINVHNLNDKQKNIYKRASEFQIKMNDIIRVDLDRCIVIDSNENIFNFNESSQEFDSLNKDINLNENTNEISNEKTMQKKLTPSPNTIYGNNV